MKIFTFCFALTLLAAHFSPVVGQTVIANYTEQIDHLAIVREGNVIWLAASGDGVLKCALDGNVLERYTSTNGLAGNTVYDILLDQQGRRWFATDAGISVLDAANVWTQHPFFVRAFAEAPNGDIWAAGNSTYKLDAATGTWATFAHSGSYGLAVKIAPDSTVYVGGKTGMAVRNPATLEWAYFRTFTEDPDGHTDYHAVVDFEWDAEDNLWVIKGLGLFTFADSIFSPVTGALVNDLPNYAVAVALEKMPNGNLLIGTRNGLWMYDGAPIIKEYKSRPGFRAAFDFAVENDSTLWFGSELGFSFFDGVNFEHYTPDNHTLASENIQKILIDTDDKKWFLGTHAKSEFDNTLWTAPYPNSTVDLDASFEPDGTKWFVRAYNSVTNLVRLRDDSITLFPGSATGLSFYTRLCWDPIQQRTIFKGNITDNVFWYCKNDSFQSFSIPQSQLFCGFGGNCNNGNWDQLRRFFISSDGTYIWANRSGYFYTHRGYSFDLGQDTTVFSCGDHSYTCPPPYCACNITNDAAFDSAGNTWYASDAGVLVYSHPAGGIFPLHYFTSSNSGLPNDTVQCIVLDAEGRSWIGTRNGLAILDTDLNWTVLNADNVGLVGNNIQSIAFDTDGSVWVGTESGVSHITSTTGTVEVPPTEASTFRVFPNPVASGSSLTVEIVLKKAGEVGFELTDAAGKVVREFSFSEKTIGNQVFNLKTAGVPAGVYFLTARLEGKVLGTEKVILK